MSMLDRTSLNHWIVRFHEMNVYYLPYGLNDIFKIASLWHPDLPFMAHMRSRWNPTTRTFHLGDRQFCPTVEDFRAIMMVKTTTILRLKPFDDSISFKKVLREQFKLSKNFSDALFKNNVMDLQMWHNDILRDGKIPHESSTYGVLVTIFLAHFLLTPAAGKPSVKVFDVMHNLRQGPRDISGIVLAETLMGLNERRDVPELQQQGSSFVLYMWLADKVKNLLPVPRDYVTDYIVQKSRLKLLRKRATIGDNSPIHELTPWHGYSEMIHSMDGLPRVVLLGLEKATSYFTTPLATQFGRKKMPLADTSVDPFDAPITSKLYHDYAVKWSDACKLAVPTERKETIDDYIVDPLGYKTKIEAAALAAKRPREGKPSFVTDGLIRRPRKSKKAA